MEHLAKKLFRPKSPELWPPVPLSGGHAVSTPVDYILS